MSASNTTREGRLAEAFVDLADTLVADYDVVEVLQRLVEYSVELLEVTAAGVLLADHAGQLHVMAASSASSRVLELLQLQNDEGPCLDCARSGKAVDAADLDAPGQPWPRFAEQARKDGFRSVHALPMRLREQPVGALNFFGDLPGELLPEQRRVGQALADVATIGVLQERAVHQQTQRGDQLQQALDSRVIIEQAKGVLAQRGALDMDAAFSQLRAYARSNNRRLSLVAGDVVARQDIAQEVLQQARPHRRRTSA